MLTSKESFRLRFPNANATDGLLDALVASVTKLAQGNDECRRVFDYKADVVDFFDGGDTRALHLARPPVHSITSVHVSLAVPRVYDATTLLDASVYDFDKQDEILGGVYRIDGHRFVWCYGHGRGFPSARRTVRVEYAGGWGADAPDGFKTIPEDLEQAANETIDAKLQKGLEQQYHITSQRLGDDRIDGIRFEDVPDTARRVFRSYRIKAFV